VKGEKCIQFKNLQIVNTKERITTSRDKFTDFGGIVGLGGVSSDARARASSVALCLSLVGGARVVTPLLSLAVVGKVSSRRFILGENIKGTSIFSHFPKKHRLGPQNGSGSEKLLKIVNYQNCQKTVLSQLEKVGGHRYPPGSILPP
jgi:hypothetical protein